MSLPASTVGFDRTRNTTKCESAKFTTKLANMATSLASHTGNSSASAATSSVAVLAIQPTMPEATKAKYARHRSLRPDSAAKVMVEFMIYEPLAATTQAMAFAAIKETAAPLPHSHKPETEANSAMAAAEPSSKARAIRKT